MREIAIKGVVLATLTLSSQWVCALTDILDTPARISARAAGLIQLAIARAGDRLVSVGERGIVLLSDDNGKTWRQASVPVSVSLTRVRFVDARLGWAVGHGGVVLRTQDGGETWKKQLDGIAAARIELNAAKADGDARRIAEAERLLADGADKPLLDVCFFDTRSGMVVGAYGLAFRTEDGGQSWTSLMGAVQVADGRHLNAIQATGDKIYLFGEQGTLLASSDGGSNFAKLPFPGRGSLFGALSGDNGDTLLAYGLKGSAFRSVDAGRSWQRLDMPPVSLTAGLRLRDGTLVIADEAGQLYRSQDQGRSFKPMQRVNPAPIVGLVEAADGSLVVSGVRGSFRIESMIPQ